MAELAEAHTNPRLRSRCRYRLQRGFVAPCLLFPNLPAMFVALLQRLGSVPQLLAQQAGLARLVVAVKGGHRVEGAARLALSARLAAVSQRQHPVVFRAGQGHATVRRGLLTGVQAVVHLAATLVLDRLLSQQDRVLSRPQRVVGGRSVRGIRRVGRVRSNDGLRPGGLLLIHRVTLGFFGGLDRRTRGVRGGVADRDALLTLLGGVLLEAPRAERVRRWLRAGRRGRVFVLFLGFLRADVIFIAHDVLDDVFALLRALVGRVRPLGAVRTCRVRHGQLGLPPIFSPDAFCDSHFALVPVVLGQNLRTLRRRHVRGRVGNLLRDHVQIFAQARWGAPRQECDFPRMLGVLFVLPRPRKIFPYSVVV